MEEYEVRDVSRRSEAPDLGLLYRVSGEPTARRDLKRVGAIDETNEAVDWQVLTWVEHAPDGTQPVQAQIQVMPVITNDAITPAEHICDQSLHRRKAANPW
jgi:hypothetical protein